MSATREQTWTSDHRGHAHHSQWMMPRHADTTPFKWLHHFSKSTHFLSLFFRRVTGQLIAEKLLSSFNQASHVTARLRRRRRRRRRGRSEKKSLSAVMSKASIFTEQLGVSSQRSDVRTHYGSATTNCFKVKVADLTVLYFKWQTQILAVATQSAVLAWRHCTYSGEGELTSYWN